MTANQKENLKTKIRELLRSAYPANDNQKKKTQLIVLVGVIFAIGYIVPLLASKATYNSGLLIQQEGDHNVGVLVQEIKPEIYWTDLTPEMREKIRAQGFILFPEILDMNLSSGKWTRVESWLFQNYGVKYPYLNSLWRDRNNDGMQQYYARLLSDRELVFQEIENLDGPLLSEYWGFQAPPLKKDRIALWLDLIDDHVIAHLGPEEGALFLKKLAE